MELANKKNWHDIGQHVIRIHSQTLRDDYFCEMVKTIELSQDLGMEKKVAEMDAKRLGFKRKYLGQYLAKLGSGSDFYVFQYLSYILILVYDIRTSAMKNLSLLIVSILCEKP